MALKTSGEGLPSKLVAEADGARGILVEFALLLSEVIDGQIDFGPTQDELNISTLRCRSSLYHSHHDSGSTESRDGVEGRGSTPEKNEVRMGYTSSG